MLLRCVLFSFIILLPAFGADPNEIIKVPCVEFQRLIGASMPCDVHSELKVKRSEYDSAKRGHALKACRDEVLNKYAAYGIKRTDKGGWRQYPKPDNVAEKDWTYCGPFRRIWNGDESHACWEELVACEKRHSPPPIKKVDKPKKQIKLF